MIKEDEIGGARNTHEKGEKCKQNFIYKPLREESSRKTWTYMGGQY
jgi:hypothetical protein